MSTQQDDIARTVAVLWSMHREMALWPRLMGFGGERMGTLAKAAGATPAQVQAWMSGGSEPTTQQALAVLAALRAPVTVNGGPKAKAGAR